MWWLDLFPWHTPNVAYTLCTRASPQIMCDERRDAQRAGEMYYAPQLHGWVYPAEPRVFPLEHRPIHRLHTWLFCPFCGGDLPGAVDAVQRLLKAPPSTPPGPNNTSGQGDGDE